MELWTFGIPGRAWTRTPVAGWDIVARVLAIIDEKCARGDFGEVYLVVTPSEIQEHVERRGVKVADGYRGDTDIGKLAYLLREAWEGTTHVVRVCRIAREGPQLAYFESKLPPVLAVEITR